MTVFTPPTTAAMALNRLTLCFRDAAVERDFRLQRAEAARPVLRRFLIFMVLLVLVVSTLVRHEMKAARLAGMPVPPQLTEMSVGGVVFGASLAVLLFSVTLSRRLVPYLHRITVLCMGGLVLVDSWHSLRLPMVFALNGTLLTLVVLYVASQLRFAAASALGLVSSALYLSCLCARHVAAVEHDPLLRPQLGVTALVLVCANLLLMFVSHQRELSARTAYYRARQLEQRGSELEKALTHLKQAELQLVESEKLAAVGRLVAGILHEMNSPLGALSSATQTVSRSLQRVRDTPGIDALQGAQEVIDTLSAAQRLTRVQAESGERIGQVVDGLRQFVSLDQGALHVADVRVGLETAASFIGADLRSDVALELKLPASPLWVQCFPGKLNQVFLNLLKNAVSAFAPEVEPASSAAPLHRIVVEAVVVSEGLRIEIRDTGRGMSEEDLARVFELDFSRQGSRVKLRLGLPASRGAVEEIGGSLTLESELGRGSVAVITLPLATTPAVARASAPASAAPRRVLTPLVTRGRVPQSA